MDTKRYYWIKPSLVLLAMAILVLLLPEKPIDPWSLFSPKKLASMILALAMVQILGSLIAQYLGTRPGAILTGFFGGLISSTATTAALARRSKTTGNLNSSGEILTFLSATAAMLFECLVVIITGTQELHFTILIILFGPIVVTIAMILVQYAKPKPQQEPSNISKFEILPTIKLSVFILLIIAVSKIFQDQFGKNGLLVLTPLVSLFEIHGSIIANVQLHESGTISVSFLCSLLAISIASSYVSKLFLIFTLGSKSLKKYTAKSTFVLIVSLLASWAIGLSLSLTS